MRKNNPSIIEETAIELQTLCHAVGLFEGEYGSKNQDAITCLLNTYRQNPEIAVSCISATTKALNHLRSVEAFKDATRQKYFNMLIKSASPLAFSNIINTLAQLHLFYESNYAENLEAIVQKEQQFRSRHLSHDAMGETSKEMLWESLKHYTQKAKNRNHGIHFLKEIIAELEKRNAFDKMAYLLLTLDTDWDAEEAFKPFENISDAATKIDLEQEIENHLMVILETMFDESNGTRITVAAHHRALLRDLFEDIKIFYEHVYDDINDRTQNKQELRKQTGAFIRRCQDILPSFLGMPNLLLSNSSYFKPFTLWLLTNILMPAVTLNPSTRVTAAEKTMWDLKLLDSDVANPIENNMLYFLCHFAVHSPKGFQLIIFELIKGWADLKHEHHLLEIYYEDSCNYLDYHTDSDYDILLKDWRALRGATNLPFFKAEKATESTYDAQKRFERR